MATIRAAPAGAVAPEPISPERLSQSPSAAAQRSRWTAPRIALSADHLARRRVVSYAMSDPSHVAFNLLRTRTLKILADNHWRTLAVTSPTPGCGKTMVAVNLAFAMSRSPDCRTVLIDLDLKKPAVADVLGIGTSGSIGRYLEGKEEDPRESFVEINDNLIVGLNYHRVHHSSELIRGARMKALIDFVQVSFGPDVILFDLPPMHSSDDAIAFLPSVDGALLVVAAGTTTEKEVDECEQQVSQLEKLIGVVLNKAEIGSSSYY